MKKKDFLFILLCSIATVLLFLALYFFIGGPLRITGSSMEPYLKDKDIVYLNRLAYVKEKPQRFDLVVFSYKYNKSNFVKRVIALPGETISIVNDVIYITDKTGYTYELKEFYGIYEGESIGSISNFGPLTLNEDEYFVLGDNRYNSSDSRFDDVGAIHIDEILGKVTFRLLPLNGFGGLY